VLSSFAADLSAPSSRTQEPDYRPPRPPSASAAHDVVDWIANYMEACASGSPPFSVQPDDKVVRPGWLHAVLPPDAPDAPEPWSDVMSDFQSTVLPGVTHWQHPRFLAYFPANASGPGVLGEMLSAALNVVGFSWVGAPSCTELEEVSCDWAAGLLGLGDAFRHRTSSGEAPAAPGGGGVIQGTASEAACVALLAARCARLGPPSARGGSIAANATDQGERAARLVVYCSDQAHSCVRKAAMVCGVGHVREVPANSDTLSLEPAALAAALESDAAAGLEPLMVVASVGTTGAGAVDDVAGLGRVCQQHRWGPDADQPLWLHVDAAYAGSFFVSPEFRSINGAHAGVVDAADSFDFNPHKGLLTNFDCSLLFVRDRIPLVEALTLTPAFLQNRATASGGVVDFKDWQIPLGRRMRSLKLWATMRCYGRDGLQAHVRRAARHARSIEERARADPRFALCGAAGAKGDGDGAFGLACVRLVVPGDDDGAQGDAATRALLEAVNASGDIFVTHAILRGRYALRLAFGGTHTRDADADVTWAALESRADAALAAAGAGKLAD